MIIKFIGACREVTGSVHYVEACGKRFIVDYGMEQGEMVYEKAELPVPVAQLDFVLLTHAHIDHSGLIPLLYTKGFKGPIFCTGATKDLCDIMLRDSAHIQEFEAQWRNRKGLRKGSEPIVPLYTAEDVYNVMKQFKGIDYGEVCSPAEGIRVQFTDVGHLLGSASITITLEENGAEKTMVFSGDVGNSDQPILKNPHPVAGGDFLVIESTYGNRSHPEKKDPIPKLLSVMKKTFDAGGNVVIPSFAVGRTQELLYFFRQIKADDMLPEYRDFRVYVDSPLAVSATSVFEKNKYDCYDGAAMALLNEGINPLEFPGLILSITTEDSASINFDPRPKVILSASGMCEAGRIKHHLKHNLWRPASTILFAGYQAHHTLGRAIVEGAKTVKIFGEEIAVNARIETLEGISGHADREGLLRWIENMQIKPKQIFVVHGEESAACEFAQTVKSKFGKFGVEAVAPYSGDTYDLAKGEVMEEGDRKLREKKLSSKRSNTVFNKLVNTGERLNALIMAQEGHSNKDLAKMTSQIEALIDKWED